LKVCQKFGVTEEEVTHALAYHNPQDPLSVAYHLIIDNKIIYHQAQDFFLASSPPSHGYAAMNQTSIRSHPERIAPMLDPAVDNSSSKHGKRVIPVKRAKWHLGIRSQSRPRDIMLEVFKSMKKLNYSWNIVSPFHVKVKRVNPVTKHENKISLQLYQVDYRSYLLDFCSLSDESTEVLSAVSTTSGSSEEVTSAGFSRQFEWENQADTMSVDSSCGSTSGRITKSNSSSSGDKSKPINSTNEAPLNTHYTMEFFEMCSNLITALAR